MATALRPADARHQIANLRAAKDRAYGKYHDGEISLDQLCGLVDFIDAKIRAVRGEA